MRGDSTDNVFSAYPGVRTKGTRNKVGLQEAFEDLLQVNDNLMQLLEPNDKDFGNEYVEEIGVQVDEYISDVESYLVERKDDPPSTSPSTCSDVNSDAGSSRSSKSGAYKVDKVPSFPVTKLVKSFIVFYFSYFFLSTSQI